MRTRITKNFLVHYDDRVVGEVIHAMGGGYAYKHYSFRLKASSALPSIDQLLPHVDAFLKSLYE